MTSLCLGSNNYMIIPLTQGQVTIIDKKDFKLVSKFKWCAGLAPNGKFYAKSTVYRKKKKNIYLHRLIKNAKKGQEIDHINGLSLDNRQENLRLTTRSENQRNRGFQKNNKSGFKGVCKRKDRDDWLSQIKHLGKVIHLGYFSSKKEAALAYDRAARKLHGKFAHFNFPK